MTGAENANIIEILRGIGWSGEQINDFQLGIEGRVSVKETIENLKKNGNKSENTYD